MDSGREGTKVSVPSPLNSSSQRDSGKWGVAVTSGAPPGESIDGKNKTNMHEYEKGTCREERGCRASGKWGEWG